MLSPLTPTLIVLPLACTDCRRTLTLTTIASVLTPTTPFADVMLGSRPAVAVDDATAEPEPILIAVRRRLLVLDPDPWPVPERRLVSRRTASEDEMAIPVSLLAPTLTRVEVDDDEPEPEAERTTTLNPELVELPEPDADAERRRVAIRVDVP